MKKYAFLLLICVLASCTRSPLAGQLSVAGAGSGSGNLLGTSPNDPANRETQIKRQEITDAQLEASANKINNVLDDNSPAVDLEHLADRSDIDPDLANTPEFRHIQQVEKKFDEKARDLIDNTGENLNIQPEDVDPALKNDRNLAEQLKTEQQLNDSASDLTQDKNTEEPSEEDAPAQETDSAKSDNASAQDSPAP